MRLRSIVAVVVTGVALSACAVAPIANVDNAVVMNAAGKPLSKDQVRGAIVRAGSGLGWQMKDEGPNTLVGTLMLRSHTAVVEIPYSSSQYSIKYRSSVNLNEANGQIHKNYNGWIQNLNRAIGSQLAAS